MRSFVRTHLERPYSPEMIKSTLIPQMKVLGKRATGLSQSRYLSHVGVLAAVGVVVAGNAPAFTQSLAYRTVAARGGGALDVAQTASVAADVAHRSSLLVATEAHETALRLKNKPVLPKATAGAPVELPAVVEEEKVRETSEYEVQEGDTLTTIAELYNVTPETVKWANNLSSADDLTPGQKLTILPVSGVLHVVAEGDTLDAIAKAYSADLQEVAQYNRIEEGKQPEVGAKVIVVNGVKPEPKPAPAPVAVAAAPAAPAPRAAAPAPVAAPAPAPRPALTQFSGGRNSYAYGYCTYYVASRRSIPGNWGNANTWLYNAQASGFSTGSVPVPGAIAWTGAGYAGHVAYVESVSGGMVTISEMNFNGNWNRVTSRTVPASSFRYIY